MSSYGFPNYFFTPPPPAKVSPAPPPPPTPRHSPPPPVMAPPPPRKVSPPPPPPPHITPSPPSPTPALAPPPPHIVPPSPPSPHHATIIIFVSFGGLFFLAFLVAGLCCLAKKKKKRVEESEVLNVEDHIHIHETVIPEPHGQQVMALSVDEDIKVQEVIKKNEIIGIASTSGSVSQPVHQGLDARHPHFLEHKG